MLPGKTTYFSRIQILLELSISRKHRSSTELIENIYKRSPPNFAYSRRDITTGEIETYCSLNSIKNTLALAIELDLIDSTKGLLTKEGKIAANPHKYEDILKKKVVSYLSNSGCPIAELEKICRTCLTGQPIKLPTADELYNIINSSNSLDISLKKFRILLRLLADSGGISTNRKQIFIPHI